MSSSTVSQILNVAIDNITLQYLLQQLSQGIIVTPNVDHIVKLQKDRSFYEAYQHADYVICDSKLVQYASKFLGTPIQEKISGSDFFPAFCEFHKDNNDITVFLLGSKEGIAATAAKNINHKIGRDIIIDYCSPSFGFENNADECQDIIQQINTSKATVLAIGVGAPKQEKWIAKYKDEMPHVNIFMAIGATIDFEAGIIMRAPKWMSESGLEWLYRLMSEPKRLWKRYLFDGTPFFWLILKQKFDLYKNPWQIEKEPD